MNKTIPLFETLEGRELLSVSPASAIEKKIGVKNLFDVNDVSLNQSLVSIPFTLGIRLKDASKIAVRGYAVNPLTGHQIKLVIKVLDIHVDPKATNYLVIKTDRLMRRSGGKILIQDGALTDTKKRDIAAVTLSSPKGQNKERFTLASRSFIATKHNLFSDDIFADASAPTDASSHVSAVTVATNLKAFLDKKVTASLITQAEEDAAIARFNDSKTKSIIPDANLRAAMVSLVGTIGAPAIGAMLDGANTTAKASTVIDFSSGVSQSAEVAETLYFETSPGVFRLRTLFRTSYAGEPFQALSTWIAHEALHQDADAGQNEAIATNVVETMVWAQQLMVDSSYVTANTALVKTENVKLLGMLNSGKANFPRVGMLAGTLHLNKAGIFYGEKKQTGGAYVSYEDYVRRLYVARGFGTNNSHGNATLNAMMNNITGLNKKYSLFDATVFTDVDGNQQIITDKSAVALAGVLKLTVA